ncbi:hypothetical protein CcI49_22775 [Frankia sp. CcI49]|nr:hypothetical protein CcI49_22775 [Frankia sp. CcI49]
MPVVDDVRAVSRMSGLSALGVGLRRVTGRVTGQVNSERAASAGLRDCMRHDKEHMRRVHPRTGPVTPR